MYGDKALVPIVYHPRCAEYHAPGHPERPERILDPYKHLVKSGFDFITPQAAEFDDLLLIHSSAHIDRLKTGNFIDPETPPLSGIFDIALISAGGAMMASDILGFSLCRPPGHHATKDKIQGFCYLNNIAIAVAKKIKEGKKVAIIDIDCHHGNGTEEIFQNNRHVIYISLHQSPLYPGTGLYSHDNIYNFPVPAGTGGREYLDFFDRALVQIENFKPDLVAVSAGFDTYKDDPITGLKLGIGDYYEIGKRIKTLKIQNFSVLEGGYSRDLAIIIENYLKGLCEG